MNARKGIKTQDHTYYIRSQNRGQKKMNARKGIKTRPDWPLHLPRL